MLIFKTPEAGLGYSSVLQLLPSLARSWVSSSEPGSKNTGRFHSHIYIFSCFCKLRPSDAVEPASLLVLKGPVGTVSLPWTAGPPLVLSPPLAQACVALFWVQPWEERAMPPKRLCRESPCIGCVLGGWLL